MLSTGAAWRHIWQKYMSRVLPFALMALVVTAGAVLAYAKSRSAYSQGYDAGREARVRSMQSTRGRVLMNEGEAMGYEALAIMVDYQKATIEGVSRGWCLVKLGPKYASINSPIEDMTVFESGKEYSVTRDGTVWYRARY